MTVEFTIYFAGGMVLGLLGMWFFVQWRHNQELQDECRRMEAEICELEADLHNLSDFNDQAGARKEERKQHVLSWLRAGETLQSSEIARRLGISTRTARNYLTELEEAGVVLQRGDFGRDVVYQIVTE